MSVMNERRVMRKLVPLDPDEKVLDTTQGSVSCLPGDDFLGRDGILFVTDRRVGVSAAGGLFTSDDARWAPYHLVRSISVGQGRLDIVMLDGGTLRIESDSGIHRAQASRLVECGMSTFLRSDLLEDFQKAVGLRDQGFVEDALAIFDALQARQNRSLPLLMQRMSTLDDLGRGEEALAVARQAAEIGGFEPEFYCEFLAYLALKWGQLEEAERVATETYEAAPRVLPLVIRGQARLDGGEIASALLDAEKAVSTDPMDVRAWLLLARIGAEWGDAVVLQRSIARLHDLEQLEAASVFESALLLAQGDPEAAYRSADAALTNGLTDPMIARAMVHAAVELESDAVLAKLEQLDSLAAHNFLYQLGACSVLLQHRRSSDARARLESLSLLDNTLTRALRGCVAAAYHVERGEWGEARDALAEVVASDSPDWLVVESYQSLWTTCCALAGWAALEVDDAARAAELLLRAEAGTPSELPWIRSAIPELAERATTRASLSRTGGSAVQSATTYEVLCRLDAEVRRSRRLAELSARVQHMLDDFDEAPVIAVMGEYSVGKSSFINALIQQPLLPTGEGVTTGTITVLRHGTPERMRAVFRDGRVVERDGVTSVEEFVKETGRGIEAGDLPHHVDVFLPSDVLRTTTVVDTPGLNAPFPEHRKITESFLAEADAIVWLFNVETAGRSTEKEFLDKLGEHRRKTVGVVNQIDLVPKDELDDVLEAIKDAFPGTFASVHPVSAKRALDALRKSDPELGKRSGMPSLFEWLEAEILSKARPIKEGATREKVRAVLVDVRTLRENFDALTSDQLNEVRATREDLRKWIDRELASDLSEALAEMRQELEAAVKSLATAALSAGGAGNPQRNALAPVERAFLADAKQAWDRAVQTVLARYDARIELLGPTLDRLSADEWQGVLDASRRALSLSFESWRKDLEDYAEQLYSYASGFADGGGVHRAYVAIPSSERRDPEHVRVALRLSLSFSWERAQVAFARWTGELRANTVDALARLEREMRAEVARTRETSFREVERLALPLDGVG